MVPIHSQWLRLERINNQANRLKRTPAAPSGPKFGMRSLGGEAVDKPAPASGSAQDGLLADAEGV